MNDKKLNVGIIGCGNIGKGSHLPGWQANDDLAAVAP